MTIEDVNGALVITGEDIQKYRIHALKGMLKLEMLGMRRSSGRSVNAVVKQEFGLSGSRKSVYSQFCRMHGMEE